MLINPSRCPCPDCGGTLEITDASEQELSTTCTVCLYDFVIETTNPEAKKLASDFILNNVLSEC